MLANRTQIVKRACLVAVCVAVSSCALLPSFGPSKKVREQVYTLNPSLPDAKAAGDSVCGSLALGDAMAAPGFRTSRMAYSTAPYEIDYFAYARWADSFARLLRSPLQSGFAAHSAFSEVLASPTLAPMDFRIEFTDVSAIQRFASRDSARSTVVVKSSVRLFATNPNKVLATKDFRLSAEAGGDPASGVEATNKLVAQLVGDVTAFASSACRSAL